MKKAIIKIIWKEGDVSYFRGNGYFTAHREYAKVYTIRMAQSLIKKQTSVFGERFEIEEVDE